MEIDLSQIGGYAKTAAIGGLSLTAIWAILWPLFKKWFDSLPKTNVDVVKREELKKEVSPTSNVNSDKQPPVGFIDHVNTVLGACLYADPATQLKYLSMGLTESEVLKREVARMGKPNSVAVTTEPVSEVVITSTVKEIK